MLAPTLIRKIRIAHFCPWADALEEASVFLQRLPTLDLKPRVAPTAEPELLRMARLDCDWHGENTRAFAALTHAEFHFLPAHVTGARGLLSLAQQPLKTPEERWLIFDGQNPQKVGPALPQLLPLLRRAGWKILLYGFDEVSRTMPCFPVLAPFLSALIHDESPLDPVNRTTLSSTCTTLHRSWVANLPPFSSPFNETPEERILFLGSKMGLTPHRQRQIDFLQKKFRDRFVAIYDHSISVADRATLGRFKVSLCPEGRKFTSPSMSATHTDRPFWSGCLGMVPVSENSAAGGRLETLHTAHLIERYEHADLPDLARACHQALDTPLESRRHIYEHFNHHETVGSVVASIIAATPASHSA